MDDLTPLRIGDAAKVLGITDDHLRDLTPRGKEKIPCSRTPGGHRLFDPRIIAEIKEQGLEVWMQDQSAAPDSDAGAPVLCHRSHHTVVHPILLLDFGNATVAGFGIGDENYGKVPRADTPCTFKLETGDSAWHHIEEIAILLDPLVMSPKWAKDDRAEAAMSYTQLVTTLLAGHLAIECATSSTQEIPISDLRVTRPDYPDTTDAVGFSPGLDLNAQGIAERAKLSMPPNQSWRVLLRIPNRAINRRGKESGAYAGYIYQWSGLIQVAIRKQHEAHVMETAPTPYAVGAAGLYQGRPEQ